MKTHNPYIGGIPDMFYSGVASDLWVEYKFEVLPKREGTMIAPNLSALQLDWLQGRYTEGRNVAVIIGCKEGGVIFDRPIDWGQPISKEEFMNHLMNRHQIAEWIMERTGGPP